MSPHRLLGPAVFVVVHRCLDRSGTPDQISDDEVRIPRLHGTFPPQPSAHAEVSLPRPGVSCLFSSPSPPIVRPQPALQAVADALLGMIISDLFLFLLPGSLLAHVPPLHLRTQVLPWTVWMAHVPLSPLSSWVLPLQHLGCCLSPTFLL
jgi:hypothetical protein